MRGQQIRFILILSMTTAMFVTTAMSVATADESKAAKIARAMRAAPTAISKNATIVDVDGTVLRSGSNGWHCLPGSAPGNNHPVCNDEVWMRLMKALDSKADFKADRMGVSYMLQGDAPVNNADPFDTRRDAGEVWIEEGPHLMILMPDPKTLEGISDDPNNDGPYVMWKGTPYAHIMVPVAPRPQKKK
jgi:hypothetical protein